MNNGILSSSSHVFGHILLSFFSFLQPVSINLLISLSQGSRDKSLIEDAQHTETCNDSLFRFWNEVEESAISSAIGHHPLPRARHEATDCPCKGLPAAKPSEQQTIRAKKSISSTLSDADKKLQRHQNESIIKNNRKKEILVFV